MGPIRTHLRLFVGAWLTFQVGFLSALVPVDCCAAHRPKAESSCHEPTPPPATDHCAKAASHGAGALCARHADAASDDDECTITGTCGGPMAALSSLLSNHGILADSLSILPSSHAVLALPAGVEDLIRRLSPPDTPPPRA